jgi:hypothetical protein
MSTTQSEMNERLQIGNPSSSEEIEEEGCSCLTIAQWIWQGFWYYTPYSKYLSRSFNIPDSIKKSDKWKIYYSHKETDKIQIKSMFHLFVMYDALLFRWTKYFDNDPDIKHEDIKDQIKSDCQNVGLLSALLSTICFAMLIVGAQEEGFDDSLKGKLYTCCWCTGSLATLVSTAICVLLVMAIEESTNPKETAHFLELLNAITFGTGSLSPMLLLYLAEGFVLSGLFLGLLQFFSVLTVLLSVGGFVLVMMLFATYYFSIVTALKCTRDVKQIINKKTKKVSLKFDDIKSLLKQCQYVIVYVDAALYPVYVYYYFYIFCI